jgi:hypothetical protein
MTSTKQLNFRLPEELDNALKKYVQENNVTQTYLVKMLLQQGLAQLSGSSIPPTTPVTPLHPAEVKVDVPSPCVANCLEQQKIDDKAFSDRVDTLEDYTIKGIESLTQQQDVFKSDLDKQKEQVSNLSVQVESFLSTQTALQTQVDKLSTWLTQLEVSATQGKDCIDKVTPLVYSVQQPSQSNLVTATSLSPPTTDSSLDKDGWLSTREAHAIAQENGYKGNPDNFRRICTKEKDPELIYAQYGLEFDKERQGKRGSRPRCWRRLSPNNQTEQLPENQAQPASLSEKAVLD